ncbi:apolipoprotein D-like [Homarus americanus]
MVGVLPFITGLVLTLGVMAPLSQGLSLQPGKCPEFITKLDFEVAPYLGKWIEFARFTMPYERGQTCNYAEYSDRGDGTVGVHNGGLDAGGNYTEIFGYAEKTPVNGVLVLHLDGVPVAGDYNVLATDYTTYTAVYSCNNFLNLGHVDQAWILARTPTLTKEQLEPALAAFSKWGIDTQQFFYTPQENCDYP